jgi:hypothetical protein
MKGNGEEEEESAEKKASSLLIRKDFFSHDFAFAWGGGEGKFILPIVLL